MEEWIVLYFYCRQSNELHLFRWVFLPLYKRLLKWTMPWKFVLSTIMSPCMRKIIIIAAPSMDEHSVRYVKITTKVHSCSLRCPSTFKSHLWNFKPVWKNQKYEGWRCLKIVSERFFLQIWQFFVFAILRSFQFNLAEQFFSPSGHSRKK